ncbi:chalcone synthase B [Calycina marina]|uniref:Chalcone synthase B n=1 Tax=Calycina marina TaxID=1763456 RepID=A0A9P7Z8I8_9HELO|nr:chalcone synthase B [Calycina marina]
MNDPTVWITGIASESPPHQILPENLETLVAKFYDIERPGIKKLLAISRSTGAIQFYDDDKPGLLALSTLSPIHYMDDAFRRTVVDLNVKSAITHTIAVSCTNLGSPGYDLLVVQKLGLKDDDDRMLLHGVGCAKGVAQVQDTNDVGIAAALFSDSAAAFVICNEFALEAKDKAIHQLIESTTTFVPGTSDLMSFLFCTTEFRTTLTRQMVHHIKAAVAPMFRKLVPIFERKTNQKSYDAVDFDWALHTGGKATINGIPRKHGHLQRSLASYQIHLLNQRQSIWRVNVLATAFGPGLLIEMAMLRRCRKVA